MGNAQRVQVRNAFDHLHGGRKGRGRAGGLTRPGRQARSAHDQRSVGVKLHQHALLHRLRGGCLGGGEQQSLLLMRRTCRKMSRASSSDSCSEVAMWSNSSPPAGMKKRKKEYALRRGLRKLAWVLLPAGQNNACTTEQALDPMRARSIGAPATPAGLLVSAEAATAEPAGTPPRAARSLAPLPSPSGAPSATTTQHRPAAEPQSVSADCRPAPPAGWAHLPSGRSPARWRRPRRKSSRAGAGWRGACGGRGRVGEQGRGAGIWGVHATPPRGRQGARSANGPCLP